MNPAGTSRAPRIGIRAERVESVYEQDLRRLVGQLSLAEINEMQGLFTRIARDGRPLSDRDMAMEDLLQQARNIALFDQDRALAQRIAAGEDIGLVDQRQTQAVPRAAPPPNGSNRRMAPQQNGNHQQQRAQPAGGDLAPSLTWGRWLSSIVGWAFGSQPAAQAEPVAITARTRLSNRPTGHDCVICQDPIRGAEIRAPCGHYYDLGCIIELFQSATRDETLFPPRCCRQNIPFAQVRPHLSQALITSFREKETEFGTLKRVYCSSPTCSRFLGPLSEGVFAARIFVCPTPSCGRRTCGKCRQQHSGDWTHACRPDADAAHVLELSRASGWARCPGCSQMIELHVGCFHMTCRCRTEFCYLCRARWKTCRCPQWDERRLLAAAEERVDARLGPPRAQGARADVLAQRARPAPVLVPAPAPLLPPRPPAENVRTNRAQVVVPGTRPPAPTPIQQRQVPGPALVPAVAPAQTLPRMTTNWAAITRPAHSAPTAATATASSTKTPTNNAKKVVPASTSASASSSASGSHSPIGQSNRTKSALNNRTVMVREMMERLRVEHDCDHDGRWHYRDGGGHCQTCGHHLPLYLFRCHGCDMLACNRCRRNRL